MRCVVLLLGGVALVAGRAAADPIAARFTKEFQAGVDAYRLGKYDDAVAHLDRAQAIDPRLPGPHRFLAAVAKAQSRWPDCIAFARRALQLNPQSAEAADTRKLHDDCRSAAGRPAYPAQLGDGAALAVTANVRGATVRIGGLRYGGTPMEPRLIKPGPIQLDVEKPGYKPAHVAVDALRGIVTDVEIELEAEPPASPVQSTKPIVAPRRPA